MLTNTFKFLFSFGNCKKLHGDLFGINTGTIHEKAVQCEQMHFSVAITLNCYVTNALYIANVLELVNSTPCSLINLVARTHGTPFRSNGKE